MIGKRNDARATGETRSVDKKAERCLDSMATGASEWYKRVVSDPFVNFEKHFLSTSLIN